MVFPRVICADFSSASHLSVLINEAAKQFDISRPAVSKHINVLNEDRLVMIRKEGRKQIWQADPRKLREVAK